MQCEVSFFSFLFEIAIVVIYCSESFALLEICVILSMAQDTLPSADSPRRRSGLLRDQVQLIKRKDTDRYEIAPIQDPLAFEKGFFVFVRACQLLAQKNEGMVLVGVAGPSGAGKTVFTEKILTFMPSIAVINMDNYNDASRIIDGNFDGTLNLLYILRLIFTS